MTYPSGHPKACEQESNCKAGSAGFLLGLSMGIVMECFHCEGKYCNNIIAFVMCVAFTMAFLVRFLMSRLPISSAPGDLLLGRVFMSFFISRSVIRSRSRSGEE